MITKFEDRINPKVIFDSLLSQGFCPDEKGNIQATQLLKDWQVFLPRQYQVINCRTINQSHLKPENQQAFPEAWQSSLISERGDNWFKCGHQLFRLSDACIDIVCSEHYLFVGYIDKAPVNLNLIKNIAEPINVFEETEDCDEFCFAM